MTRGVYAPLKRDEIATMRAQGPSSFATELEARLFFAVESREGTLRRLHNAVIATPLEGTELREAMQETEKVLGIDP